MNDTVNFMALPYWVLYVYVFIFGTVIGSFLNVVIYRLPRGISFVRGRSMCPSCEHTLGAADLVPIFSWLFLGGKCRYCKARISPRYALVELLGGLAAVLCVWRFLPSLLAVIAFAALSDILCIVFIDIDTMEIPNGLILFLIAPALGFAFADGSVTLVERLIGLACISVPMLLLTLLIPDCFGGGDIKLIAVCGFMLGWRATLLAMFVALLFGGGFAVYLMLSGKKGRKEHFAFGPFIGLGVFVSLLFANDIIKAYLSLFIN